MPPVAIRSNPGFSCYAEASSSRPISNFRQRGGPCSTEKQLHGPNMWLETLSKSHQLVDTCRINTCLQNLVPALIESVKVAGLVLLSDISDTSRELEQTNPTSTSFHGMPHGVDGVFKADGVLRFAETIDL